MSDKEDVAQPFASNSDLFDAEIDSEPEEGNQHRNGVEPEAEKDSEEEDIDAEKSDDENKDDEDKWREMSGEEEEITKGKDKKSKKAREPRKLRLKKADIQKVHSESQRLIRESNVKLPYHQPETKNIAHFLKRVPIKTNIQTKQKGNSKTPEKSSIKDDTSSKMDDSPPAGDVAGADDGAPDDTAVQPKLSAASDPFFLDVCSTKKPAGMNHLMERFFKHSRAKAKKNVTEILIEEEKSKPEELSVENEVEKLNTLENTKAGKSMKLKPKIIPGGNLSSLKEKLEEHMKLQRAEIRKIHESQRKIDNEELSEEEEEEDFEDEEEEEEEDEVDEEDTDFEVDEWNAKDEREQEEYNKVGKDAGDINTEDDRIVETDAIGLTEESNSVADSEFSHDRTKLKEKDYQGKASVFPDEKTMDLFSSDTSNQNTNQTGELADGNESDSRDSSQSIKLRLDSIDDTEDMDVDPIEEKATSSMYTKVKSPTNFTEQEQSSDGSLVAAQPNPKCEDKTKDNLNSITDNLTPFSRIQKLLGVECSSVTTKEKRSKPLSELTLPIDDSQDLYDDNDDIYNRKVQNELSKDFHFALDEDTQFTQFVDTQGYLLSTSKKKKNAAEKNSEVKNNMSELLGLCSGTFSNQPKTKSNDVNQSNNMSELLGLCSGKFPDEPQHKPSLRFPESSSFGFHSGSGNDTNDTNQDDMNELLGLCSGRFSGLENSKEDATKGSQSRETKSGPESGIFSGIGQMERKKTRSKQGLSAMFDAMADENSIDDAVALCSGKFPSTQKSTDMDEPIDADDETNDLEDGNSSDEEVFSDEEENERENSGDDREIDERRKSKKFPISYGKPKNRIFDKKNFLEEEAELSGSDASSDEEEDSGDDELQEDSEVEDLPSDEELQRQVNKVHMKSLIAEDKRELRALQERYLEDGDLYSEGGGRSRNFKWQGLEDSQMDLFDNKILWGDDEIVDSELLSQDEIERRKMRHEKEQFLQEQMKCGSVPQQTHVDENSQNILNLIKDTSNAAADVKKVIEKPTPKPQDPKPTIPSLKRGSFLNRSKDQLCRLSSITGAKKTPNSTRGFVFHTVSPTTKNKEISAKKLQRSASLSEPPNAKRPRLERSFSNIATGSLFSMM